MSDSTTLGIPNSIIPTPSSSNASTSSSTTSSTTEETRHVKTWNPYRGYEGARQRMNHPDRLIDFCQTLEYVGQDDVPRPQFQVTPEPPTPSSTSCPSSPDLGSFGTSGERRSAIREWKNKLKSHHGSKLSLSLSPTASSSRLSLSLYGHSSRSSLSLPGSPVIGSPRHSFSSTHTALTSPRTSTSSDRPPTVTTPVTTPKTLTTTTTTVAATMMTPITTPITEDDEPPPYSAS